MKRPNAIDEKIKDQKKDAIWTRYFAVCAVAYLIFFQLYGDKLDQFQLLREKNNGWEVITTLPGSPHRFFSAQDGDFLVEVLHPYSLSIQSGGAFLTLPESGLPFGTRMSDKTLAIGGGKIWAVGEDSVASFEGGTWKRHTPEIDYSGAVRLLVGPSLVWILDSKGTLVQLDGNNWEKIVEGGPARARSSCEDDSLHLAPNNEIWLICDGVWKLNKRTWVEVQYQGNKLILDRFLGFTKASLWGQKYSYYRVPFSGSEPQKLSATDVGIESNSLHLPILKKDGTYSIYVGGKLYDSSGDRWDTTAALPNVPHDHDPILGVVADEFGSIWALGRNQDSDWSWAFVVWQIFTYGLLGLFSSKLYGRKKVALINSTLKSLPPDPVIATVKTPEVSVFFRILTFPIRLACVFISLGLLLPGAAIAMGSFKFFEDSCLLASLGIVTGFYLAFLGGVLPMYLSQLWRFGPAKKGNYLGSLRRQDLWDKFFNQQFTYQTRTMFLLLAGKFEEALIRSRIRIESTSGQRDGMIAFNGLCSYSEALLGLGRYAEAEEQLENCVKISPESSEAKKYLALSLLLQDKDGERARAILEDAASREKKFKFHEIFIFGKEEFWVASEIQGYLAWAYALLGQTEESKRTLEEAYRLLKKEFVPQLARLHYCKGHILRLSKEFNKSKSEFAKAAEIDPHGAMKVYAERAIKDFRFT